MVKDNGLSLQQKIERAQELIRDAFKGIYAFTIDAIVSQLYTAGLDMLQDMAKSREELTTQVAALNQQLQMLD
jgi:hypothetical protein